MKLEFSPQALFPKSVIHIGTDTIRSRMGEILDCVNLRGDEFLIERKQKPLAVLIPVQKHKLINKIIREFLSQSLAGENKNLSQEEAEVEAKANGLSQLLKEVARCTTTPVKVFTADEQTGILLGIFLGESMRGSLVVKLGGGVGLRSW